MFMTQEEKLRVQHSSNPKATKKQIKNSQPYMKRKAKWLIKGIIVCLVVIVITLLSFLI